MIKNYITIMLRSMVSQKFYTVINVLCLTVGIAFALLIGIFISGELEVNQSLKGVDRLFLMQNRIAGQATNIEFFGPPILPKLAIEQYPAVFEDYYRFWDRNITVSKEDKHFRIQSMIGDPSFLRMFGFTVLHGDEKTALNQPDCVIITEAVAKMFFDKTDVINETVSISTEQRGIRDYKITAVIEEPDDKNTVSDLMDMNAQIFLSVENRADFYSQSDPDSWDTPMITYAKLTSGEKEQEAESILNKILQANAPKPISENRTIDLDPLADYYLVTNHGAVMKLILSLSVIVIFILMLAITNFVNIAIASSFARMKEVGIRKVMGGVQQQLVIQFLFESLTLAVISGILSLGLYQILYPLFNELLNAHLPSLFNFKTEFWLWIVCGVLLIGLLAGAYPALFQSATKPMESLKARLKAAQGTISFSRVLIITQFVITGFVFIGAIVLSTQTSYFLERDLGYNKSHVVIVYSVPRWWTPEGFQKMEAARNVFLESSKIKAVSLSWGAPAWGMGGGTPNVVYKSGSSAEQGVNTYLTGVDESFDEVFGLKLLEGDFFFPANGTWRTGNLVLNESARNALAANVGDKLRFQGSDSIEYTVAGIIRDFNYESLHESVKPQVLIHNRDESNMSYRFFSFQMEAGNMAGSVAEVERVWKKAFPAEPFNYSFADEKLQAQYATELQLKKASTIASVLMLIIVMTGVLGLVSLNVSKRNKEIGIRKVLGATVPNILMMFTKEYARLMIVSFILAIPLAWYFSNQWLQNFVYHIDLSWWMFVVPGILLLLFTVAIVSIQSYQTAVTDPVKSLKYE
jgi:putative ABC transport system permease protein